MGTVLVVHAEPQIEVAWHRALEAHGLAVVVVESLPDGLEALRDGGVDVILLDGMGSPAGVRAFMTSLGRLPDAPPFVIVSGATSAPELSARYGAAGLVLRPCSADDVVAAVGRVLEADGAHAADESPTSPHQRPA